MDPDTLDDDIDPTADSSSHDHDEPEPESEPESEPEPRRFGPPPISRPAFSTELRDEPEPLRESVGGLFGSSHASPGESAFRIVELRVGADGRVLAKLRRELTAKVFNGPTSLRMARYEAMNMPKGESVLVLLRPSGSAAGVWATGTGRKAPPSVARRAKAMVRELLPHLFSARTKRTSARRTSRASNGTPKRSRRTSRAPAKAPSGRTQRRSRRG
jgi:hypothetical protein